MLPRRQLFGDMMKKAAISLTTETLVIIAAAIILLLVAIIFISGGFNEPLAQIAQLLWGMNLTMTPG